MKKYRELLMLALVVFGLLILKYTVGDEKMGTFSLLFLSILFEAIPFILIGSFVSSLISVYVSPNLIEKFTPKNQFLGLLLMSISGLFIPLCECSIVPISKRLIEKKLPISMAIAFMLSVPVVNPVVIFSTYYAFASIKMALTRALIGIVSGVIIGYLVGFFIKEDEETYIDNHENKDCCHHNHDDHIHCCHDHECDDKEDSNLIHILSHSLNEFISMGKYLILGAFISSTIQMLVPTKSLTVLGQNKFLSVLAMMTLAYILSICSEADAFIARGFMKSFSKASVLSFLTFGPMLDLKNTLMIFASFRKKHAVKICSIIVCYHLVLGLLLNFLGV